MLTTASQSSSGIYRHVFRLLSGVDWWLAAATTFLILISLTTLQHSGQGGLLYSSKQLDFVWAGIIASLAFWWIPYYIWVTPVTVLILYLINLALLFTVMIIGHSALGAQRWLSIGPITLQPSEIAKLVIIFTLAAWLNRKPIHEFLDILKAAAIIALPALLVFKQPDLGTSLTFGAVFIGVSFWAGATINDIVVVLSPVASLILNALNTKAWYFYSVILGLWLVFTWRAKQWKLPLRVVLALVVVLMNFGCGLARPHLWGMLKEYQQKRLLSFVNPYEDPRGSGYHILQSLIAIGSGGLNGVGLGKGNQSQGAFIPEQHTDFIFSVVGEELGFRITALIIAAYTIICLRALAIAYQSREQPAGSLIAIGILSMFLFHVFLNLGMTMGIMPVAGVPLPFLSYGGTALITNLIAIGILQSIRSQNPAPKEKIWR